MRVDLKWTKHRQGEEWPHLYVGRNGISVSNTNGNTNGSHRTGPTQPGTRIQNDGQGHLEQDQVHARWEIRYLQTSVWICGIHYLARTSNRPQQSRYLQTANAKQRSMEPNRRNLRKGELTRQMCGNIWQAHLDMHSTQQSTHMEGYSNS